MTPRPGTVLRPTGRGICVLIACPLLWLVGDLTRVQPARQLALALLLMLLIGAIGIAVSGVGLRPHRELVDDAVPVGGVARVRLELEGTAWITVLPLGRGIAREHLPEVLGGQGDLPLGARMPHVLRVDRRGEHPLGPVSLLVRDVFGLFHLRRTVADGLHLTGLPVITELSPAAARTIGITGDGAQSAATSGVGEIGPLARPYASGDDIRRIHWRASARTGRLMTREEEPTAGHSAVVVLDTTHREHPSAEVEDRLVSHAATLMDALGTHGWEVRVVDAAGDEITRTGRRHGTPGASPVGREADAVEQRAALLALAQVDFDDPVAGGTIGHDHASGHTALAIALGLDEQGSVDEAADRSVGDRSAGERASAGRSADGRAPGGRSIGEPAPAGQAPFADLVLDRFAGRAAHRTAIALAPAREDPSAEDDPRRPARRIGPADGDDFGRAHLRHARERAAEARAGTGAPTRSRLGTWTLVRGTTADTLDELLADGDEGSR